MIQKMRRPLVFTASMAHPSNTDFLVRAVSGLQLSTHPGR